MCSQDSQRESADYGVDMSELQAHHCITPEQWSWLLCSVNAIPANKVLLQELNQLIGIKMLQIFKIFLVLSTNFQGWYKCPFRPTLWQTRNQVSRFRGEKYIFKGESLFIITYFNKIFKNKTKIWGHKKIGVIATECSSRGCRLALRKPV